MSAGYFGANAIAAFISGKVAPPDGGSLCAIVGASGEQGLFEADREDRAGDTLDRAGDTLDRGGIPSWAAAW